MNIYVPTYLPTYLPYVMEDFFFPFSRALGQTMMTPYLKKRREYLHDIREQ